MSWTVIKCSHQPLAEGRSRASGWAVNRQLTGMSTAFFLPAEQFKIILLPGLFLSAVLTNELVCHAERLRTGAVGRFRTGLGMLCSACPYPFRVLHLVFHLELVDAAPGCVLQAQG